MKPDGNSITNNIPSQKLGMAKPHVNLRSTRVARPAASGREMSPMGKAIAVEQQQREHGQRKETCSARR